MNVYVMCIFLCCVVITYAQDCRTSGQTCGYHENCCGGCCYEGHCIDTYQSCLKRFNVCRDHVCVGEENCVEFRPPGCLRCCLGTAPENKDK